ncbi:MAG: aspartate kinase [Fibromonadaceae bacterium]|jgi:aspartate kinase|nr:aspartate kinase [Fibromonadaceae bacterium]
MSNRIVCKFGGSSVADATQFRKIKSILEGSSERKIVVVSAPGKRNPQESKLTDLLYSVYDLAQKKLDFAEPWKLIRERYIEIAQELSLRSSISEELDKLEKSLLEHSEELSVDFLVSRGEYLCAKIMAEFLNAKFIDSFPLIQFDSQYRVTEQSYENIAIALSDANALYVVPGFYGSDIHGNLKTFTRGGSDITGGILANACGCHTYENWTDVSGLLMADPRIVQGAHSISYVSYREIRELAYSGANVLHDESISPCRIKNIPINIKNTNQPGDPGTIIGPTPESTTGIITGIAGRKDFSMLYIEKSMMNKEKGFGRKVLTILEERGVSYELSPCGIDSMNVVVDSKSLHKVEAEVCAEIEQKMQPNKIKIFNNLALIATVGHGMVKQVGTAARLFTALAKEKINVRIIDQGSSEINIIIGVDEADFEKSITAIYREFVE